MWLYGPVSVKVCLCGYGRCVCVHVRGVGVWLSLGIPLRDGSEVVNLDLGDIIGVTCLVRGRRGC